MGLAPKTELIKHWHERQAALGQAVLHLRWYLGVLNALDKTIGDQTSQRRGERLVSSRRKLAFELVVARRAVQVQAEQNWQLVQGGLGTLTRTGADPDTVAGGPRRPHCSEAWDAVSRYIYTGLQGGSIMRGWMERENEMICCCNDGTRPVIFKLERIDIPEGDE